MDIALIVLAGFLLIVALIGCVVPALPGPLLGYVAIILVHITDQIQFTTQELVITGIITAVVMILDYIIPSWYTKKFGGSSWGVWGSLIGLIAGLILPIPFGVIVGPFVGAIAGELIAGRSNIEALKSGVGSLVGFLLSTGIKIALVIVFCVRYVQEVSKVFINS